MLIAFCSILYLFVTAEQIWSRANFRLQSFFFQETTFQGEYKKCILEINSCKLLFWARLLCRAFYNIRQSLLMEISPCF